MRWALVALAMLLAPPTLANGGRHAALVDALREAQDALCPRCVDDMERTGVNRPMLRMMRAEVALDRVHARLDEAALSPGLRAMLRARVDAAAAANAKLDEHAAAHALFRAQRLLRSTP